MKKPHKNAAFIKLVCFLFTSTPLYGALIKIYSPGAF